jgi:hypothetical protein
MPMRAEFLHKVESNLQHGGFRVTRGVELPDGQTADVFGSRTHFSWKGFVILSQHVCVQDRHGEDVTPADAQALFDTCFRRAKKVNRVPLLRGMQFGYMVVPCLVVSHADPELIEYAESKPRKHWSLFEFPVVVDRFTHKIHYYRDTAMWGALFFSDMRKLVESSIVAAATAEAHVS